MPGFDINGCPIARGKWNAFEFRSQQNKTKWRKIHDPYDAMFR
jgi:hypothetical protein